MWPLNGVFRCWSGRCAAPYCHRPDPAVDIVVDSSTRLDRLLRRSGVQAWHIPLLIAGNAVWVMRERSSRTRQLVEESCKRLDIELDCVMQLNSREAIVHAIVKGIGIGFVSAVEYAETPGRGSIRDRRSASADGAAGIAKLLFFVFLLIFVVFLVLAALGVGALRK